MRGSLPAWRFKSVPPGARRRFKMPTKAADLKKRSRKVVTTKAGNEYLIRRLSRGEIVAIWKGVPDITGMDKIAKLAPEEVEASVTPEQTENLIKRMEAICEAGMMEPSIGPGEDQIELHDLEPEEVGELSTEIWNLTKARSNIVRP